MRFCHEFESILHSFVHLSFASFKISSLDESIPFEPATFDSILHKFVYFSFVSLDESIPFEPVKFDSILHKFVYFSFVSLDETCQVRFNFAQFCTSFLRVFQDLVSRGIDTVRICHVRFNFVYFSFVSLDESILRLKNRNCYARDSATFESILHNFVYPFFVSFKISRRIDISFKGFSIIVGTSRSIDTLFKRKSKKGEGGGCRKLGSVEGRAEAGA